MKNRVLKYLSVLLFSLLWVAPLHSQNSIIKLEYWFDGNSSERISKTISPNASVRWIEAVDADGLNDGVHTLSIRFCDTSGMWSIVQSFFVFKHSAISKSTPRLITKLEYWTDGDIEDKTVKTLTYVAGYHWLDEVDMSLLNDGVHTINVRFGDDLGVWSPVSAHFVFKHIDDLISLGENKITGYRVWYSVDTPDLHDTFELANSESISHIQDEINADFVPKGKHQINFQVKDMRGIWSPVVSDSITQDADAFFSFMADKREVMKDESVQFTPSTLHFIEKIVWDFGDGNTEVSFEPSHTYDSTGEFDVAATVWHYGRDEGKEYLEVKYITVTPTGISSPEVYSIRMFPVPVKDRLHIESPELQIQKVQVVDLSGKIAKEEIVSNENSVLIPLDELKPGNYLIMLTTDKGLVSGKIIKQR